MIRCGDGTLYTGISTDVKRRFEEHCSGGIKAARYLRGRGPLQLVYAQAFGSRSEAAKEEYRIKQLPKVDKEALVASMPADNAGGRKVTGAFGRIRPK